VSAPAGVGSLSINGVDITGASPTTPVVIPGSEGTLTITNFDPTTGAITYGYTEDGTPEIHNAANNNVLDSFTIVVVDLAGQSSSNTLDIQILDDVPTAVADTATVAEGGTVSGNVVTDVAGLDTLGADGAPATGPVTAVNGVTGNVGTPVAGTYGSLTLNADGSYSYQSTPNSVAAGTTASDVFQYTITDGDGDTSTVTLTISIPDGAITTQVDLAPGVSDLTVDEAALGVGSNPGSPDETATGQLITSGGTGPYTYSGSASSALGTLTVNPDGSYSYTLNVPTTDLAGDETDSFTYTVTDDLGNTATQTITITIVDDVPTAVDNFGTITEDATPNTVTGNVVTDVVGLDTLGADGVQAGGPVTPVVNANLAYGTLTLSADGSYTYTLDNGNSAVNALNNGQSLADSYVYTITDADGDTSTATLTITINGVTDLPTLYSTVSEEGLLGGEPDTTGVPTDTTDASSTTPAALPADVTDATVSSLLTSGGAAITWSTVTAGSLVTLTGELADGTDVMRVVFDNAANNYTVQLLKPLDHPTANGENLLTFTVGLTTVAGDMNLQITVEDDAPTSDTLLSNSVVSGGDANVMIILDTSYSMIDPALDGPSRFANAKAAAINLLDSYGANGDVRVRLVLFNDAATTSGGVWMTLAEAKTAINGAVASGATNYDDALAVAMAAYNDPGRLVGAPNYSYFLTDGTPTKGDGDAATLARGNTSGTAEYGIQPVEEAIWTNFLTENGIKSQALAFSSSFAAANASFIDPIAYDGSTGSNLNGIHVADPADLSAVLVSLAQLPVTGTIPGTLGKDAVTNADEMVAVGADGGYVHSVTVMGGSFTYDPTGAGSVTLAPGTGTGLTFDYDAATQQLTVYQASTFKTLVLDVLTGEYSFTAPANTTTVMDVVLRDKDLDEGTVKLTLNVNPDPSSAGVPSLGAVVSEEGLSGGYIDAAGIYGDTTNAASVTQGSSYLVSSITGPGGFTSGGVAVVWGTPVLSGSTLTLTGTAGGSPVMTVAFDTGTGAYTVTLLQGLDHNPDMPEGILDLTFGLEGTLSGSPVETTLNVRVEDDMAGGNLILGTTGTNTLTGDANANLIVGWQDRDTVTGGGGADTFAWFQADTGLRVAPNRVIDQVQDFHIGTYNIADTSATAADRLDLSSLLQGETSANLANYIYVIVDVANNRTELHISVDGGIPAGSTAINATNLSEMFIYLNGVTLTPGTQAELLDQLRPQIVIG